MLVAIGGLYKECIKQAAVNKNTQFPQGSVNVRNDIITMTAQLTYHTIKYTVAKKIWLFQNQSKMKQNVDCF